MYLYIFPENINFWEEGSIGVSIISFVQVMIGFYIASLAAIATFSRDILDKPLDGDRATLNASENGITHKRLLTRRHFLTYLFGYLSFISIFIYILGIFFKNISPVVILNKIIPQYTFSFECFFIFLFLFLFSQLIILTLFGLFYLSDRLQWFS